MNNGASKIGYENDTYLTTQGRAQLSPDNKENPIAGDRLRSNKTNKTLANNDVGRLSSFPQTRQKSATKSPARVQAHQQRSSQRYETSKHIDMIEQLSGLALNVRKQTSPESRHEEPTVEFTQVDLDTDNSPDQQ